MIVFFLCLVSVIAPRIYVNAGCNTWSSNIPLEGRTCIAEYTTKPDLSWDLCVLECIRSYSCLAISYITSSGLCMLMPQPCPLLTPQEGTVFALIADDGDQECVTWDNMASGSVPFLAGKWNMTCSRCSLFECSWDQDYASILLDCHCSLSTAAVCLAAYVACSTMIELIRLALFA